MPNNPMEAQYIWHNGALKPFGEAKIHVLSHALHYGSAVFEGIRCYETPDGPNIFRLADHIDRMVKGATVYRLALPFSRDQLQEACRAVVRANGYRSAYVRPIAFKGFGSLQVHAPDVPIEVAVATFPWGEYLGDGAVANGIDVCVSSWSRLAPNTIPTGIKAAGGYLSGQLISAEAHERGFAEGIALGPDGLLSEGAGENLFLVMHGKLHTPPAAAGILSGITRDTIIRLAKDRGIEVIEQALPREALYLADEAFFTGTAAEVTPIRSVDRIPVGDGRRPVTQLLSSAFFDLVNGRAEDPYGWMDPVGEAADYREVAAE